MGFHPLYSILGPLWYLAGLWVFIGYVLAFLTVVKVGMIWVGLLILGMRNRGILKDGILIKGMRMCLLGLYEGINESNDITGMYRGFIFLCRFGLLYWGLEG